MSGDSEAVTTITIMLMALKLEITAITISWDSALCWAYSQIHLTKQVADDDDLMQMFIYFDSLLDFHLSLKTRRWKDTSATEK